MSDSSSSDLERSGKQLETLKLENEPDTSYEEDGKVSKEPENVACRSLFSRKIKRTKQRYCLVMKCLKPISVSLIFDQLNLGNESCDT